MDESGSGFVHGRGQRRRRLEAVTHNNCPCRSHLWQFPGARLHFLFIDRDRDCRAAHEHIEVGDQLQTTEACRVRPHGAIGERAAGIHVDFPKTGRAPFGRI